MEELEEGRVVRREEGKTVFQGVSIQCNIYVDSTQVC